MVGVDGSDLAVAATGYAFELASQRGLGLTVLHAWDANVFTSGVAMSAPVQPWAELVDAQEEITSVAIAGLPEKHPDVDVGLWWSRADRPTSSSTPRMAPSCSWLAAADAAAAGGLLLRSVSRNVLHPADGPVAVVRPSANDVQATSQAASPTHPVPGEGCGPSPPDQWFRRHGRPWPRLGRPAASDGGLGGPLGGRGWP